MHLPQKRELWSLDPEPTKSDRSVTMCTVHKVSHCFNIYTSGGVAWMLQCGHEPLNPIKYKTIINPFWNRALIDQNIHFWQGAVHKRRPQSGGLSNADILQTRRWEVLHMRTSVLFGEKISDISKFMVCPHGQGGGEGVSQCEHIVDKGRGAIFRNFVQTSLTDGL